MTKRFLSLLLCLILSVSLFSANAFADTDGNETEGYTVSKVKEATPAVTLSKKDYTWNGKAKKPSVTVSVGSETLTAGTDYTVAYKNNTNVGKAKVKITLKGKYSGSGSASFKIRPKGTQISEMRSGKKSMIVNWEKQDLKMSSDRITGYQVQTAADKEFTQSVKTATVKGYKNTSVRITRLSSDTRYYFRVRTYTRIGEKNYFSAWSKIKSQKTKKIKTVQPEPYVPAYNSNDAKLTDMLYDAQQDNTIVSPMSIHLAMAMLLEGASGQTQTELENFLGVKKENLDAYIKDILLSAADQDDLKTVISNAFWYQTGQPVKEAYINTLKERYSAGISDMDFSDTKNAADIINAWCNEKTNGLIPVIVTEDDLADVTDVIMNTLYFKAPWMEQVEESALKEAEFKGFKNTVKATYLQSDESIVYENDKAVAFEKLYKGRYSFIGILPKQEGPFTIEDLDVSGLMNSKTAAYDEAYVMMPKFTIESGGEITGILQSLGVNTVFTPAAELDGIAPEIMASKVIHKTKMILDENGTEAAAATAVAAEATALPPGSTIKIILDRPYAFLIIDRETKKILFMGKVTDL